MSSMMLHYDDRYELPVKGGSVTGLLIDWAVTFQVMADPDEYSIRIGQPFEIRVDEAEPVVVDPEGPPTGLAAVLGLLRLEITRVAAFKDGHLEADFASGTSVTVPPSDDYEPWEINAQSGARIVSTPGGSLTVWDTPKNQL